MPHWKSIEAYHQGIQYGSPKVNALATLDGFKKDYTADHLVQLPSRQNKHATKDETIMEITGEVIE